MAYCTLDDIKEEIQEEVLIEITDLEETGAINEARVVTAIERADSIINAHLGVRIPVPVDPVPDAVNEMSVDIALYTLFSRNENVPKLRTDRHNMAIRMLKDFAAGNLSVGAILGEESSAGTGIVYSAPSKDFDEAAWRKY
jgi:phage gp36-like protein